MENDGWFVPISYIEHLDSFMSWTRKRPDMAYTSYYRDKEIIGLVQVILFRNIDSSFGYDICDIYDCKKCSQKHSEFCKQEESKSFFQKYDRTDYFIVWENIKQKLYSNEDVLIKLIGKHRVDSFKEYMSMKAMRDFKKYTNREIKERKIKPPVLHTADFIGLEEIQEDPWQQYLKQVIEKGDLGCLQLSDSELSELLELA